MTKTVSTSESTENQPDTVGRDRLLLENLAVVRYIARSIYVRIPSHVSFDDLFHAGILGLIDAIDKFNPQKNAKLQSYARFRIRGAILDSLRQLDWSPRSLRHQAHRLERASHELTGKLGHDPSVSEVASKLGVPTEDVQRLRGELRGLGLQSLPISHEEGSGQEGWPLAFRPEEDPFQVTLRGEIRHLLGEALSELDKRDREVLGLYYVEELTMKRIGTLLGICESRVSQVLSAALVHLRSRLVLAHPHYPGPARTTAANAGDVSLRAPRVSSNPEY